MASKLLYWILVSLAGLIPRSEIFYVDAVEYRDGFAALTDCGTVEFLDSAGVKHSEYKLVSPDDAVRLSILDGVLCALYSDRLVGLLETSSGSWEEVDLDLPKSFEYIDFACLGERCYALDSSSRILRLDDEFRAEILDFNELYSAYYGPVQLTALAVSPDAVCVAGVEEGSGRAVAFVSEKGSVWSRRELDYTLDGSRYVLENQVLSACYSTARNAFVLGCSGGVIFYLPACSHCNYPEYTRSGDVRGIAFNGETYIAVGEGIY